MNNEEIIGRFGEVMKLAALVFVKEGKIFFLLLLEENCGHLLKNQIIILLKMVNIKIVYIGKEKILIQMNIKLKLLLKLLILVQMNGFNKLIMFYG